jgi:hypothetical protein
VPFDSVVGLGKALHDNPQLPWCAVRRTFAYATGTRSDTNNRRVLEFLSDRFAASGYVFPALMREITTSYAFRNVYEPRIHKVYPLPDLKSAQRSDAEPASNATALPVTAH